MGKMVIILLLVCLLNMSSATIDLNMYSIDVNIKSSKGWRRVCNNDKIHLYVNRSLTKKEKEELCKMVIEVSKMSNINREIENIDVERK